MLSTGPIAVLLVVLAATGIHATQTMDAKIRDDPDLSQVSQIHWCSSFFYLLVVLVCIVPSASLRKCCGGKCGAFELKFEDASLCRGKIVILR